MQRFRLKQWREIFKEVRRRGLNHHGVFSGEVQLCGLN